MRGHVTVISDRFRLVNELDHFASRSSRSPPTSSLADRPVRVPENHLDQLTASSSSSGRALTISCRWRRRDSHR
jgi:hypothetical protein